ncbi:MAG: hypothetical protein JSS46_08835 [Proteobacteria bacterium]|jgi:hypothetical protein|nr:hypothetical protein [Pseudomonadota bacterium]
MNPPETVFEAFAVHGRRLVAPFPVGLLKIGFSGLKQKLLDLIVAMLLLAIADRVGESDHGEYTSSKYVDHS